MAMTWYWFLDESWIWSLYVVSCRVGLAVSAPLVSCSRRLLIISRSVKWSRRMMKTWVSSSTVPVSSREAERASLGFIKMLLDFIAVHHANRHIREHGLSLVQDYSMLNDSTWIMCHLSGWPTPPWQYALSHPNSLLPNLNATPIWIWPTKPWYYKLRITLGR